MALLSRIAAGAESYNADFSVVPGPVPERGDPTTPATRGPPVKRHRRQRHSVGKSRMAENFTVGLLGGIYVADSTSAGAGSSTPIASATARTV